MTIEEIQNAIYKQFVKSVVDSMKEERYGIHVSDLVYECLRRAYYGHIYKTDDSELDDKTLFTFWIGKKLHEVEVTDMHEFEVEAFGVKGRIDEVIKVGEEYVIIDKKTTRHEVEKPYQHHIKQVQYYAVLLRAMKGISAKYGSIVYINVSVPDARVYVFDIGNLDEIEAELKKKASTLQKALEEGEPPEANPYWLCKYCAYRDVCSREGGLVLDDSGR